MDLSIIIVNYNSFKLTERCIESVIENVKGLKYEIIVIDNNSKNESYSYLSDRFDKADNIKIMKNEKNEGFGSANNFAVHFCSADYILFLNPDIVVLGDSIQKIYRRFSEVRDAGLISPRLLNEDLTLQYSCRKFLTFKEFLLCRTPLKKFADKSTVEKLTDKYLMKDYDHEKEMDVDWVMGSCMLTSKELFLKVGGFSKEYFMYFEDVDLCYKLHCEDKKVIYYPYTEMIHLHNQESVKKINVLTFVHIISMFKFYFKVYFKGFKPREGNV